MTGFTFSTVACTPYSISLPLIKMKTSCQNPKNNYPRLLKSKETQTNCGGARTWRNDNRRCTSQLFSWQLCPQGERPSQEAIKVVQTAKTWMFTPIFWARGTRKSSPGGWRIKEET